MVIGAIVGELLDLDRRMRSLGDSVQEKTKRLVHEGGKATVAEGLRHRQPALLRGCHGHCGGIERRPHRRPHHPFRQVPARRHHRGGVCLLPGIGVAFSAAAVFLYQGAIALLASVLAPYLQSGSTIAEMTCVGSLLIIALSLNMLGLTKIKVMNLVPAIFLPILLCQFL